MDSTTKGKTTERAIDAVQELLQQIQKSGRSSNNGLANFRALQEERQQRPTRAATQKTQTRPTRSGPESPSAAQLRIAHEEAKARRLAAEAEKARAEEALKNYRASPSKPYKPSAESKAPAAPTRTRTSPPGRPKPSKITSVFHALITGLNVQARAWEAPTSDLIALQQARRSIGDYKFSEQRKTKELAALLDEVRTRGGNEADAIQILNDLVDRKINKEEAEKRMEALKADKKKDDKGLSIAEKEELARLEIKHQQLMLQKLQIERREQERKEVEEIQKKIRDLGLPVRLSKPNSHPYDNYYSRGHVRDPIAFAGYDDPQLFEASPAFGQDEEMFGPQDDIRMKALPGGMGEGHGHRGVHGYEDDLDGYSMLGEAEDPRMRRPGRSASAHPLLTSGKQPGYETLGNTGLPKFNTAGRAPRRAQTTPPAVNFRIQPDDPRLDPRSAYYKVQYVQAYRQQQLRDAQHAQLAKQAQEEQARKLALEKKAMAEEREQNLIDAQIYQERKLQEEARAHAAHEAALQAREEELARKRNELDHVRSLEELREHEEQLNYLEELLTRHPNANIPGLDPRILETEPNTLKHVLRLVEENIRKPEAARNSARQLQLAMQQERDNAERRQKLYRQEMELNRLEALLTKHPQATIKGIDMSQIHNDPDILAKALRQVEEHIRRGENPIEIPLATSTGDLLHEARPRRQLSQGEQRLADKFLQATPSLQLVHLSSLPGTAARQRFLDTAMLRADLAQAQDIIQRFGPYGFRLEVPSDAASRVRTPHPAAVPDIPIIVVEQAKSPPPTQDTGPSFPFPEMTYTNVDPSSSAAWKGKEREGSSRDMLSSPAYVDSNEPTASFPHLPSPPATTPGRTSAAHPSGLAAAMAREDELERQKAYEDDLAAEEAELAAEEAEIERERQALVAAEDALREAEQTKAIEEAHRQAEAEAQAALQRDEDAREKAAAEMEEAAQFQARQMAEAEAAEHDAWGSLPTPPADFVAASPVMATLPTPPLPDTKAADPWASHEVAAAEEPPNIESDPAWGEVVAEIASAAGATPKSPEAHFSAPSKAWSAKSRAASAHSSPRAPSVSSHKSSVKAGGGAWSPLSSAAGTPKVPSAAPSPGPLPVTSPLELPSLTATPRLPSVVASRTGSPAASLKAASLKSASQRSPSVKAMSPAVEAAKSSPLVVPPVFSPPAPSVRSEKIGSQPLSPVASKLASAARSKVASPASAKTSTPAPSKHSTPTARTPATPKVPTPVLPNEATPLLAKTPTPVASPAKSTTPKATSPVTPQAATPHEVTPVAPIRGWDSPVDKAPSPAKAVTPKPFDAWNSPIASVKAVSSSKSSPAPPVADPWGPASAKGSPAKAPSVHSQQGVDAWGAASPGKSATPSAKASPTGGAWGTSPAAASPKVVSPVKSAASKGSYYKGRLMSPAFDEPRVQPAVGDIEPAEDVSEETSSNAALALKGCDPVVVSMVDPTSPWAPDVPAVADTAAAVPVESATVTKAPEQEPEEYPEEEYEDYSEEGDDGEPFDPADFPIFMAGQPLHPGFSVVMEPPPHVFQEVYPKSSPAMTVDAVLNHMATLAHAHGFHAIYQCGVEDTAEAIMVQGYMVRLKPESAPLPSVGGPFEAPDKNAGKATVVSDASTPGWG